MLERRHRMTYQDLVALPDDGLRHELIDGEHFVTPVPVSRHQIILGNLHRLIGTTRCGVTLFAPYDIVFTDYDVSNPVSCTSPALVMPRWSGTSAALQTPLVAGLALSLDDVFEMPQRR